ncbi:hypothetical protein M9H77_36397 [Catharanthus roseus]|uniref:Uncharacterized protein n=1 Tax=Catharanthus roseus TaxID=4058 RepID=A0ACB9ZRN7_CATRO|nr:hypothetical protein M9H77_36397 [Catharanthus roseus]
MAFVLSEPLFIFLLLFACFAQHSKVFAILESYDGYIANNLPDNSQALKIHIFSGDDDLGFHNLKVNEFFTWQFQMNFFGNTKFYGHFWWGNKERGFAVFDKHLAPKCGDHDVNACWWSEIMFPFCLNHLNWTLIPHVMAILPTCVIIEIKAFPKLVKKLPFTSNDSISTNLEAPSLGLETSRHSSIVICVKLKRCTDIKVQGKIIQGKMMHLPPLLHKISPQKNTIQTMEVV